MISIRLRLIGLSVIALMATSAFAESKYRRLKTQVRGIGDRNCTAYLHSLTGAAGLPVVLSVMGTGLYTTAKSDDLPSAVQYMVDQGKVSALTIDKPGIEESESLPEGFTVVDSAYNAYTQRDLIECADRALDWAMAQTVSASNVSVFFVGHSEGVQVLVRLLQKIQAQDSAKASRIKLAILSGLPMMRWEEIINAQVTDPVENAQFWSAYEKHDDVALRGFGDLAFAYWDDILKTEALTDTFKNLALTGPNISFQFYQGIHDQNTAVGPVFDLESWNLDRLKAKLPGLHLSARYYQAGHGLNLAALNDMIFAISGFLQ